MENGFQDKDENRQSPIQWFLLVILIPIMFAIVVTLIVTTVAGINVFDVAKEHGAKIPLIGGLFDQDEQKALAEFEKERIDLEGQIKDREAKIEQLQSKLENKDKDIEKARLERDRLLQEIDDLNAIQEENKRAFKDIVRTYETLSAKKAAPIITQMKDEEALKILTNVSAETLASIMENMEPDQAAKYTQLMTNESQDQVDIP
ncbi:MULTISPECIES: MotE family protein [unclassified Bacillus (in: firmicutes)]|uniref:MotE family protein n=1 Tax=unclassified Bacillus (in: firmicutes) TaxID=185979 RepID=UPI0008E45961|nr:MULTISPECIES: MotE family protein [unclassified Bacillus (in: firmicutes)]SFA74036.1 Flagellar motility protein MotE, a chaperone for MotC folding [Bacillus sp. UNCCL13]SFQ64263.1 Flagellar motility protein MotE, a chaperone for MotC folding [Bacillus sp. cl95]